MRLSYWLATNKAGAQRRRRRCRALLAVERPTGRSVADCQQRYCGREYAGASARSARSRTATAACALPPAQSKDVPPPARPRRSIISRCALSFISARVSARGPRVTASSAAAAHRVADRNRRRDGGAGRLPGHASSLSRREDGEQAAGQRRVSAAAALTNRLVKLPSVRSRRERGRSSRKRPRRGTHVEKARSLLWRRRELVGATGSGASRP